MAYVLGLFLFFELSMSVPIESSTGLVDLSYVVQVHGTSKGVNLNSDTQYKSEYISMTAANGKTFSCRVPSFEDAERNENDSIFENIVDFGGAAVKKLTKSCLTWTTPDIVYEVCPSVLVRSVTKVGNDEDASHEIHELGTYSMDSQTDPIPFNEISDIQIQESLIQSVHPIYTQHFGNYVVVQYFCGNQEQVSGFHETKDQGSSNRLLKFLVTSAVFCLPNKDTTGRDINIKDLLKPLELEHICLLKAEGWWSYEFCFGDRIRQYHKDPKTGDISSQYSLGSYDVSLNQQIRNENNHFTSEYIDGSYEESRRAYFEHFTGGTPCDETKLSRSTKVLYFCDYSSTNHYVISIKEVQTCSYTLKISTPVVCPHSAYAQDDKKRKEHSYMVHCVPEEVSS